MTASTFYDRIKCSVSQAPGTGPIMLGQALPAFRSFADADMPDGTLVSYTIEDGNSWELGQGTYSAANNILKRTTIRLSSSGGTTAISASSNAIVYVSLHAEDLSSLGAATAAVSSGYTQVRFNMKSNGGGPNYGMAEMYLLDANGNPLVPSSSDDFTHYDSSSLAFNLYDGNANTAYVSANTNLPQYVDFFYTNPITPEGIIMTARVGGDGPQAPQTMQLVGYNNSNPNGVVIANVSFAAFSGGQQQTGIWSVPSG